MKLGTYAVEQDYSQYVQRASAIVYAVVGTATKGPINVPTVCTSPSDLVSKFGNLNTNCLALYSAQYFLQQSSKLWFVRAASDSAAASSTSVAGLNISDVVVADALVFEAKEKGTFYDGYKVVIENVDVAGTTFDLIVKNVASTTVETHTGVNFAEVENINSNYLNFVSQAASATKVTAGTYTLSGGNNGITGISGTEYITAGNTLISDSVDINLFAVPGVADISVVSAMITVAENRADCLYLIDPPNNLSPENVISWHNGSGAYEHTRFNSSYAAIYYAWQSIYDSYNKVYVEVPPSTVVAPVFAYSTNSTEIWYAPAGLQRGIVKGVTSPVTTPDLRTVDSMYGEDNNINCIINDPQAGLCIFGQKTLYRSNTDLNRINVRMLLNYLKRVIVAASRHMTFEPNDRVTWNNFEDLVEPTLKSIKSRRGLYEYQIVKGEAVVTEDDINNYRMPCKVLIRPTKTAEEIPIYFTLTGTGAEFNEVLDNSGVVIE